MSAQRSAHFSLMQQKFARSGTTVVLEYYGHSPMTPDSATKWSSPLRDEKRFYL